MEVSGKGPVYFDCNATTPLDPGVAAAMQPYLQEEWGNAGSRTHAFGLRAQRAVRLARERIADVLKLEREDVIFTSGATESNNIAILGLARHPANQAKRHIISTAIEHKAVLEPLAILREQGYDVTLIAPTARGRVVASAISNALRDDTLLVSVMHVNNETGVIQPIDEIAERLSAHTAYFHTDAAQGFGKDIEPLRNPRIDLVSISAHKIYGPMGIGALAIRRRDGKRPSLQPLTWGGGQERGLRPGTLPVPLIVGFGAAAELALNQHRERRDACNRIRRLLLSAFESLPVRVNGDLEHTLPNVLNLSFSDVDSEAIMLALRDEVAISNGSACTSTSYEPSHVLRAMGYSDNEANAATRWSWSHLTQEPDVREIVKRIKQLL